MLVVRRYGAAKVKVASGTADSVQYIDPIESPWHTLEFKYRSRGMAGACHIWSRATESLLGCHGSQRFSSWRTSSSVQFFPRRASVVHLLTSDRLAAVIRESITPEAPASSTTSPAAGKSASGSNAGRNKRKGSALSLSDSEEDEDIHAKIARLEAENERLKVKNEDVKPKLPKGEPIGKIKHENGRVVLDLLEEDD